MLGWGGEGHSCYIKLLLITSQIARFFYTSAIPFNCVKNPEFLKALELVAKHGLDFKPPSYYDIREKYLKQEVDQTMNLLEEYKLEWKKTGCSIMSDGWTNKKDIVFVTFWLIVIKGQFFCHQWIPLICPRLLIRYLKC